MADESVHTDEQEEGISVIKLWLTPSTEAFQKSILHQSS